MTSFYQLTTLDNGLRVASEKLLGMESVTVCVSFNVGARNEELAENGLSHLLEHMAFKGTEKRTARQIAEEFDMIGGNVNAYTSMEQTVYYARVLRRYLPIAMEILSDILQNSVFDKTELEREQEVIMQEIAMNEDSPEDLIFDYLHEVAFADQPLGRSILGTPKSVGSFTADHLRNYVAKHYHTPAMVLSAAGNVEHEELVSLAEQYFSNYNCTPVASAPIATYRIGQKQVERDLEQLQVMLGFASLTFHDRDYYALQLLSVILGGGMSSRLFQEVREKHGLAYSVSSFVSSYSDTGMLGIHIGTGTEKAAMLLPIIHQEINKLLEKIDETELNRARNQQIASLLMRRENPTAIAEWIGKNLQEYGEYRDAATLIRNLEAVTLEDLHRAACRVFAQPQVSLAALGPKEGIRNLTRDNALLRLAS